MALSVVKLISNGLYALSKLIKVQRKGSKITVEFDLKTFIPARFARMFEAETETLSVTQEAVKCKKLQLKCTQGNFDVIEIEFN